MLTAGVDPSHLFSDKTPDGNLWLWAARYHVWAHALQEQCGLWMCWVACVAYRARAALPQRARAEEVRGLWTLTIWPLRGLVSSLGVFVSGKQSGLNLVGVGGGEGVSKASMTPLLHLHRFPSAALKESSRYSMLLCAKAVSSCGLATRPWYLDRVKQRIILLVSDSSEGLV